MSVTQTVVDGLQAEVAQLRQAVMAKRYGAIAGGILLVMGDQDPAQAQAERLRDVPESIKATLKPRLVHLPWLAGRKVAQ